MSSTNRGGKREISDYYQTPEWIIRQFWDAFTSDEKHYGYDFKHLKCLDPCAGGSNVNPMAYPNAIKGLNFNTIDIRQDSLAKIKTDYLQYQCENKYDIVISNPPFALAQEFILHSIKNMLRYEGFCIFLLRLNFLGGQKRKTELFDEYIPKYVYVHSKRPSFIHKSTDSIEYCHIVWQIGSQQDTVMKIL